MSGNEHPRTIAVFTDADPTGFLDSLARALGGEVLTRSPSGPMITATTDRGPITVIAESPSAAVPSPGVPTNDGDDGRASGAAGIAAHADAGIFLVSATAPVSDALIDAWDACDDLGMPRVIVITDVDSPDAQTEATIDECQEAMGDLVPVLAVVLPVLGDDDLPIGFIDLLTGDIIDYSQGVPVRSAGEQEHLRLVADERSWLIEAIIAETEREDVVDGYLAGEAIDAGDLVAEFLSLVARGRLHPILVWAQRPPGLGMEAIAPLVDRGFPAMGSARP